MKTKFTNDFIEEQKNSIVYLPDRLAVGEGIINNHIHIEQHFESVPLPTRLTIADVHIFKNRHEAFKIAQAIVDACNNYSEALDTIKILNSMLEAKTLREE